MNYLAPYLLTHLMMTERYTGWGAYNQSKLAQVMNTFDLAAELQGRGVIVNAVHPATLMDTNMVVSNSITPRSSVLVKRATEDLVGLR